MKKIITILMVTALVAGAAFARGNSEDNYGNRQGTGLRSETDAVVVSGTVDELDGRIVLSSAGKIYSLSAPGFYRAGVEVPIGETVEVTGTLMEEPCSDCEISADGHIFVARAVSEGEEIAFDTGRGGTGRKDVNQGRTGRVDDDRTGNRGSNPRGDGNRQGSGRAGRAGRGSDQGRGRGETGQAGGTGQGRRVNAG
jgi:hypothetical protein